MEFDEFKFFWRKDNVTFTIDGSKYILAVGGKLTIRNTTTSDSGLYSCVIMSADDTFKKIMPPYKLTGMYDIKTRPFVAAENFVKHPVYKKYIILFH